MFPQENLMLWDGFWNVPTSCPANKILTIYMRGDWCPLASAVSGTTGELYGGAAHASWSEFWIAFSDPISSNAATALKICSFPGLRSSLLHLDLGSVHRHGSMQMIAFFSPASEASVTPSQSKKFPGRHLRSLLNSTWLLLSYNIRSIQVVNVQ